MPRSSECRLSQPRVRRTRGGEPFEGLNGRFGGRGTLTAEQRGAGLFGDIFPKLCQFQKSVSFFGVC